MQWWLAAILVGIPLGWHVAITAGAYYDAGRVGLAPRKWTLIVFLVPIFGLFAYLFERSELSYDPETDPYRRGGFNVHPSRADDTALPTGDPVEERVNDPSADDQPVDERGDADSRHPARGPDDESGSDL